MTVRHGTGAPRQALTFAALTGGAMAFCLLQSMVVPALPVLQRALHTNQATVAWMVTAYLLSASVATPILGRLGDMFGKQRMLVLVLGALTIGSVMAGLSSSIGLMIVARLVQGLAGAVFPISFGIIRDEFPPHRVPGAIGLLSATIGIGSGAGIVVAGPVVDHLSYHWLFWFPAAIGLLATLAAALFVPESPVRAPGKVNLAATFSLSAWLVCLLVGVSQGPAWGWAAGRTLGLLGVAAVTFGIWVIVERGSRHPLVDLRMMAIPAVWWSNIAALLIGVGMYASNIVGPPFLETPSSEGYGFGASVTTAGFFMLPGTLAMLVAGVIIGRFTSRFGSRWALVVGSLAAGAPYVVLVFAHSAAWQVLAAMTLTSFGIGLAYAAMPALILAAVPASQTGVATGMNANIRSIGGSIGTVLVALVLSSHISTTGYPAESSYSWSFAVLAGAMLLAAVAALAVPKLITGPVPPGERPTGPEPLSVAADAGAMLAES